ncbi:transglutaminase domain-containing protein [Limnohabitans sp.]
MNLFWVFKHRSTAINPRFAPVTPFQVGGLRMTVWITFGTLLIFVLWSLWAIPEFMEREPMDLLKAQSGLCYDRSRTLDKVYKWLGFESRHVYILFADSGVETSPWQFLRYVFSRSKSHAVTEVKTSRGWLMVDSNSPWISLNSNMMPVPADQVHVRKLEFQHPPPFVELPFWAIRGMYSRKGQFYRPFVFFPEFNWPDFLSWVGSS